MWRNDIKCKHIFMFLQKSLAREGLRGVDRIQRASASNPVIFIQTRRVADSAVICHVISRSLAGWEWVAFSSCHMDRSCLNQSPDRKLGKPYRGRSWSSPIKFIPHHWQPFLVGHWNFLHHRVGLHIVIDFSISIPVLIPYLDTDINSIHIAIST